MAQQVVRVQPVGGKTEDQIWVESAKKVMLKEGYPMHYLDIKRHILQNELVSPGLRTTLESALLKETQKPDGVVKLADQQSGMFTLHLDAEVPLLNMTTPTVKVSMVAPHSAPRVSRPLPPTPTPTKINPIVNERYHTKYRKLRKYAKHMVFLNAAVCDEVAQVEEKIAGVKNERKTLMKKLLQNKVVLEALSQSGALTAGGALSSSAPPVTSSQETDGGGEKATKPKKKSTAKKKLPKDAPSADEPEKKVSRAKKGKNVNKNLVQPIPLDGTGRPIFPIELQALTIHSLGEIVTDKPNFNTPEHIFPSGYCSTRDYAGVQGQELRCTYTCQIVEENIGPRFEISPDEGPMTIYRGSTADESHGELIEAINSSRGLSIVAPPGKGAEFFGFSHPTVQNLIQSCPGARRCTGYKWMKYDVAKSEEEVPLIGEEEPSVGFKAFLLAAGYVKGQRKRAESQSDSTDIEGTDGIPTTGNQAEHLRSLLISMTPQATHTTMQDDL